MNEWIRILPRATEDKAGLSVVDYAQATGREESIFGTLVSDLNVDDDDKLRRRVVVIVSIVFLALTLVPVAARIYRRRDSAISTLEECFLIPAVGLTVVLSIVGCLAVQLSGLGSHIYTITVGQLSTLLKLNFTHAVLSQFSVALVEISVLFFYRRSLAPGPLLQKIINVLLIFQPLYAFSALLGLSLICNEDYSAAYDGEKMLSGTCAERKRVLAGLLVTSILVFILDASVWGIGTIAVWRLRISRQRRLVMTGILCLAFVGCIAGGFRIGLMTNLTSNMDISWNLPYLFVINQVQATLFVTVGCILPLLPFSENTNPIADKESISSSSLNCFGSIPRPETQDSLARPSIALSRIHMMSPEPDGSYQVSAEACRGGGVPVPVRCALKNMWKERGHRQQLSSSSQEILKTSTVEVHIENLGKNNA